MARYEERLWTEIVQKHGALLAEPPPQLSRASHVLHRPARRRAFAALAGLAVVLAAVLAAILVGLGSSSHTSAAFAVERNPGGTITVTIAELAGVQGANQRLIELGVPARVVPWDAACPTQQGQFKLAQLTPEQSQRIATLTGPAGSASVLIAPAALPAGDTVVIGARTLGGAAAATTVGLAVVVYEGAPAPCLRLDSGG